MNRGAPDSDDETALAVTSPGLVIALLELFESWWARAHDLVAVPGTTLTPTERQVLSLLREGLSDEAIARRLSISDRTVRRVLADLNRRAETRSRFQLGVQATELGWFS